MVDPNLKALFKEFNGEDYRGKFIVDARPFPTVIIAIPYFGPDVWSGNHLSKTTKHRFFVINQNKVEKYGVNFQILKHNYPEYDDPVYYSKEENTIFFNREKIDKYLKFGVANDKADIIAPFIRTYTTYARKLCEDLISANIDSSYLYPQCEFRWLRMTEPCSIEEAFLFKAKELRKIIKSCHITNETLHSIHRVKKILDCSIEEAIKCYKIPLGYTLNNMYWHFNNDRNIERKKEYRKKLINYYKYIVNIPSDDWRYYCDYYETREQYSNWELNFSKYPLFPKDTTRIKHLHDELIREIEIVKIERRKEGLKEAQELYNKRYSSIVKYQYENDIYKIIACKDLLELETEGKILHHCVGTYINSVAHGYDTILFLRKKSEPDTPFFTIDIGSNEELRQIHGEYNCNITEEIRPFLMEWAKLHKLSLNNCSGCLCAAHH